jgi:hypothetical protein
MSDKKDECCSKGNWKCNAGTSGGAVYGLGMIGALFYYLGSAGSFVEVLMGILKSLVWPALFVYHLFQSLGL